MTSLEPLVALVKDQPPDARHTPAKLSLIEPLGAGLVEAATAVESS